MTFEPRRRLADGPYGWDLIAPGWYYTAPRWPDEFDGNGWAGFRVAQIFQLTVGCGFLAVDYGCHWNKGVRCFAPRARTLPTLENAQDWIEARLLDGILKGMHVPEEKGAVHG